MDRDVQRHSHWHGRLWRIRRATRTQRASTKGPSRPPVARQQCQNSIHRSRAPSEGLICNGYSTWRHRQNITTPTIPALFVEWTLRPSTRMRLPKSDAAQEAKARCRANITALGRRGVTLREQAIGPEIPLGDATRFSDAKHSLECSPFPTLGRGQHLPDRRRHRPPGTSTCLKSFMAVSRPQLCRPDTARNPALDRPIIRKSALPQYPHTPSHAEVAGALNPVSSQEHSNPDWRNTVRSPSTWKGTVSAGTEAASFTRGTCSLWNFGPWTEQPLENGSGDHLLTRFRRQRQT